MVEATLGDSLANTKKLNSFAKNLNLFDGLLFF